MRWHDTLTHSFIETDSKSTLEISKGTDSSDITSIWQTNQHCWIPLLRLTCKYSPMSLNLCLETNVLVTMAMHQCPWPLAISCWRQQMNCTAMQVIFVTDDPPQIEAAGFVNLCCCHSSKWKKSALSETQFRDTVQRWQLHMDTECPKACHQPEMPTVHSDRQRSWVQYHRHNYHRHRLVAMAASA